LSNAGIHLDGVQFINLSAFEGCSSLVSALLPDTLVALSAYAFKDCSALYKLQIPKTTTMIGQGVATGCVALRELIMPFVDNEYQSTLANWSFHNTSPKDLSLTHLHLTNMETLPKAVCSGFTTLEEVAIEGSFDNIGSYAF
jgi:hypothetical protein